MRASYREMRGGVPSTDWQPLSLTGPPVYSGADPGGDYEATVPCELDANLRTRLQGALLMIEGPMRPWMGRIDSLTPDGVHAFGWQSWLDDTKRQALYLDTGFGGWQAQESTAADVNKNITFIADLNGLHWVWRAGTAYPAGGGLGAVYAFPQGITRARLVFSNTVPNSHYIWTPRYGTPLSAPVSGESVAWHTVAWTSVVGSVATADFYNGGADLPAIQLRIGVDTTFTPATDQTATASDAKVYAVDSNGSIISEITPTNVLNDSCDRLPDYVLPSGVNYRAFITPDDTTLDLPLYGPESKESEKQAAVAEFTDSLWGWWPRLIGGEWAPVPVYEPHSTTPDYYCVADGVNVIDQLTPAAFSTKALICVVFYKDATGKRIWTPVTDVDVSHLCVSAGIERMTTITVDTTSEATAIAAGQRHLASINRATAPGQITINAPISMGGTMVDPCDIEEGRIIQVDRTANGTAIGRIILATRTGMSSVQLTLQGTPISPRKAIDRLISATG